MKSTALVLLVGLLALWAEPTSASDAEYPVHPGECPQVLQVDVSAPCNDTCQDDQDCPFTQKCCSSGCGLGCLDSVLSDRCSLPFDYGTCNEVIFRYYYNPLTDQCLHFFYSGCGGNDNNFETKEACEAACRKTISDHSYKCLMSFDYGGCNEVISRYYYDPLEDQCLHFFYSGCGGNDNNFETKEACEEACGKTIPVIPEDIPTTLPTENPIEEDRDAQHHHLV